MKKSKYKVSVDESSAHRIAFFIQRIDPACDSCGKAEKSITIAEARGNDRQQCAAKIVELLNASDWGEGDR